MGRNGYQMKIFKKNIIFFISILLFFIKCELPSPPQESNGELIFIDDFNGNEINTSKWKHDIGNGSYGWGNGEIQFYQPENTSVSNGTLKIIAKEESGQNIVNEWGNPLNYTSSKIKTDGLFNFRYGRVQAKIKTLEGVGFWPAFWILPSNSDWPCDGEIDIMEQLWVFNGNSNISTGAAHVGNCPYSPSNHQYKSFQKNISPERFSEDFHIYEIRWEPNYIAWYIDDEFVYSVTPEDYSSEYEWPFNRGQWYLILNLAITNSGPNDNTQFPSQLEIDWVKVYN